ncbi:transcriptional regulator [Methanohalophilus sp. RSK]|uniref:transcriptional regulator n=1 Tax=Methanohalophilus sp. RSK TaxID=2485783 RepID=UPI001F28D7DB|nr:transcriptional regulator [Methanohalophilus sp. RSK]
MKTETPCQVVVWDVLPAIRAALAKELVDNGVTQQEVAKLFGMAPSAVSQYLTKKRGYRIEFDDEIKVSIVSLAVDIQDGRVDDLSHRFCDICRQLRADEACPADDD